MHITLAAVRRAVVSEAARDPTAQLVFDVSPADGSPPYDQRQPTTGPVPRRAAVLAVAFERESEVRVLLTRRADHLDLHAGQISLPGGSPESGDDDLAATALRETEEELGILRSELDVIGQLADVYIPPTHYLVSPFVALCSKAPVFSPAPAEVAEVIEMPLAELFVRDSPESERRELRGRLYDVPFYRVGKHKVWGATARMLATLGAALRQVIESPRRE